MPTDPHAATQAAVALRDRGDMDGAEALMDACVLGFPQFLGGAIVWADLSVRRRDWPAAIAKWAAIRTAFPTDPIGTVEGTRALLAAGDIAGADAVATEGLGRFPDRFPVAAMWADAGQAGDRWTEAENRWSALRAQFPAESRPGIEFARAARHCGHAEAARQALRDTVARFPDADRAQHDLARLAEEAGDWAEAADCWQAYCALMPPVWFAETGHAHALCRLGRVAEAEALYRSAAARFPDHLAASMGLVELLVAENRLADAAAFVDAALAQQPNRAELLAMRADLARRQGRADAPDAPLDTRAHAAEDRDDWHDRARRAEDCGDWAEAERAWTAFRLEQPGAWIGYGGGAAALRQLGRPDAAEALLREAVDRFPHEVGLAMALCDMLTGGGRLTEAFDSVSAALERNPAVALHLLRIDLAVKLKRPEAAFASWQALPADDATLSRRVQAACDILDLGMVEPRASALLTCLASEPDTGTIDWVPHSARFLHKMVLDRDAPLAAMMAFLDGHPALFRDSPHRTLWVAVLGVPPDAAALDWTIDAVVRQGRFGLGSLLFSVHVLTARPAWRAALLERFACHLPSLAASAGTDDAACLGAVLALALASMYLPDSYWALASGLRGRIADDGSVPASGQGILARHLAGVSKAGRFLAMPPTIAATDHPLRIAICVSGQLRGYREAFPTWRRTGLFDHNVQLFVHTWRNVGLNWMRNWDFLQFIHPTVHAVLARREGQATLAEHFPTLAAAATGGMAAAGMADLGTLRDFYATDCVALEDDAEPPFAGRPNDWKMLYKIQQAHRMALATGDPFDLFLRIRPDVALMPGLPLDAHRLTFESRRDSKVFMDSPVLFTAPDGKLKAGDQIAMGAGEAMGIYADTVDFDPANAARIGAPPSHKAHETLGNALFAQGIASASLEGVRRTALLNPAVLRPADVAALAEQDAPHAPDTDFAQQFLAACRRLAAGGER